MEPISASLLFGALAYNIFRLQANLTYPGGERGLQLDLVTKTVICNCQYHEEECDDDQAANHYLNERKLHIARVRGIKQVKETATLVDRFGGELSTEYNRNNGHVAVKLCTPDGHDVESFQTKTVEGVLNIHGNLRECIEKYGSIEYRAAQQALTSRKKQVQIQR